MEKNKVIFRVFWDETTAQPMFGIECEGGPRITSISTDYEEVSALAECCCRVALSPLHLADVVADFRRS